MKPFITKTVIRKHCKDKSLDYIHASLTKRISEFPQIFYMHTKTGTRKTEGAGLIPTTGLYINRTVRGNYETKCTVIKKLPSHVVQAADRKSAVKITASSF